MQADLMAAKKEAETQLKKPDATPKDLERKKLPKIKNKYDLAEIKLIRENETKYHIDLKINPETSTVSDELAEEMSAKVAHDKIIAEFGTDKARYLVGHGDSTSGYAGHDFTDKTYNAVDEIGYKHGDHSDPSIKVPGTTTIRKSTESGQNGKPNWIPDHNPPDTLLSGGGENSFKFYPHSLKSARRQGGIVRVYKAKMKKYRSRGDSDWAKGVKSSWFW